MTGFRPFFNPATGEWIEFTAVSEDSYGQLIRFSWRSVPGGLITEHIHPGQEERFIITEGEAHFTLDGEELMAGPATRLSCPPGCGIRRETPDPARSGLSSNCGPRCGNGIDRHQAAPKTPAADEAAPPGIGRHYPAVKQRTLNPLAAHRRPA
jgi:hypothetical protein